MVDINVDNLSKEVSFLTKQHLVDMIESNVNAWGGSQSYSEAELNDVACSICSSLETRFFAYEVTCEHDESGLKQRLSFRLPKHENLSFGLTLELPEKHYFASIYTSQ